MIELELFYNKVAVAIREGQAEYLKRQRSQPFPQELPEVVEATAEDEAKMSCIERFLYRKNLRKQKRRYKKAKRAQKQPVDERLTRGYNAGIEMSLHTLDREFSAFMKWLEKQED